MEKEVVIIGGGPGGYVAAIRAAQLGGKVTLVEKEELGGTCLNWGCIPTKALLRGVELLELATGSKEYGITVGSPAVDFSKMMARKDRAVKTLVSGVGGLMKANGIEVIKGRARLRTSPQIEVLDEKQQTLTLQAKKTILATGSTAADLPIPGVKLPGVIDNKGALQLSQVPQSMVVIGAGPIGLELGMIFASLGAKVTIVEMLPQILPNEDEEVASALEKSLRRFKIDFLTGTQVQEITMGSEGRLRVRTKKGEKEETFEGEKVLVAVGRRANLDGLGLEEAGVRFQKKGIEVNEKMETSIPNVYAIGDVTGQLLLAHFASAQGEVAAANALGHASQMEGRVVPRCVYTLPEVAAVGLTEKEARKRGQDVRVGKFPFAANGKAAILGERTGFVKIVSEAKYGEILGVHLFGPHATDLIGEAALAMRLEATAMDISQTIHPHPTLTEALMEAALDVGGSAVHIPPHPTASPSRGKGNG
jgi:dihydrolipoamide dehydrogenase